MRTLWGFLRSILMYYGQPWRSHQRYRFYRKVINPGDLCFDIGAHVGNRSWTWSRFGAKVVAVEPQSLFFGFLRRLFSFRRNVTVLRCGIAETSGFSKLYVSSACPTVSTFDDGWVNTVREDKRFSKIDWNGSETVPMKTLDNLIADHGVPAFCKIDVEGLELNVLKGLSQPIPMISFEYIPVARERAMDCVRYISQLGSYTFGISKGESMTWYRENLSTEEVLSFLENVEMYDRSGDIYATLAV